jgi:hypothetical protein
VVHIARYACPRDYVVVCMHRNGGREAMSECTDVYLRNPEKRTAFCKIESFAAGVCVSIREAVISSQNAKAI